MGRGVKTCLYCKQPIVWRSPLTGARIAGWRDARSLDATCDLSRSGKHKLAPSA